MNNKRTEPAAGGAAPKKKKKCSRIAMLMRMVGTAFIVLFAALAIVFVLRLYKSVPSYEEVRANRDTGVFATGISIHGVDVSGMTYGEARSLLISRVEDDVKSINISIVHDTALWLLSGADMNVSSDLDIVLTEAIDMGFDGSYMANKKLKDDILQNGLELDVAFIADQVALAEKLSTIGAAINTQPIEPHAAAIAYGTTPDFEYIDGTDGYVLDEATLASQITECLASGVFQTVLTPELQLTTPENSIEWAQANTLMRATFQTSFGGSRSAREANRVGNIQKATTILNGAMIMPGEEFDFNEYIGPRTEAGGWPLAPGIVSGNTYELQAGGGICQVSTTLYNALLCANASVNTSLEYDPASDTDLDLGASPIIITERWHHSWPSSYADRGLDATVSTGGKNLRFINNTGAPMYIFAYCDQENYLMTIYIYGEPLPDGVTYTVRGDTVETTEPAETITETNPEWPTGYSETVITSRKGYTAKVYRTMYIDGVQSGDEEYLYTDTYSPKQGKVMIGTGPSTLPTPTTSN